MKPSLRIATIAGATVAALSLVAGPAFASPQMISTAGATVSAAAAPTVKITPAHLAVHQYAKSGIVAHLAGFPASTAVTFGLGNGASGGQIADSTTHTTTAAGTFNLHYLPPKAEASQATYTLTVFYTAPAAASGSPAPAAVPVNFTVKPSDAKIAWTPAVRHGSDVTLGAKVKHWSLTAHAYVAWKHVAVKFQERVAGSWKTKATVTANTKGGASARILSPKVHAWRALVAGTVTTWGVASHAHKK